MTSKVLFIAARGPLKDRLRSHLGADWRWAEPADDLETLLADDPPDTLVVYDPPSWRRGRPTAAEPAERISSAAVEGGLRHLILISSAAVHTPSHRHAGLVSEAYRVCSRRRSAIAEAWRALERRVRERLDGGGTRLTILRPAAVPLRGGRDLFSRLLDGRLAAVPAGFDPAVQLLGAEDLAAALCAAVRRGREEDYGGGVFHVAPAAAIPLRRALARAGVWRLPLPTALLKLARRLPGSSAPADEVDYLRYSFTVSGDALRRELDTAPTGPSARAADAFARRPPVDKAPPRYDDFGLDKVYIGRLGKTLFRFLHDVWWRVEVRGLEHVPESGRAVLAGVHRGHQPWDGVMTLHLLVRELGRYPRFLIHPTLVKFPFLAPYLIRCGGVHACRENAARVLESDEIVAIFPEGVQGAFKMYREAYELGRFGRDEFVKIALRHRAPIVPYVIVGSAEIFPILGRIDWGWWKRHSEWPFLPITPTMSTVPLPSKWHTLFLEPLHVEELHGPEAADDPRIVRRLSHEVRRRMETAIAEMLRRRRSIFFGSIFKEPLPSLVEKKVIG